MVTCMMEDDEHFTQCMQHFLCVHMIPAKKSVMFRATNIIADSLRDMVLADLAALCTSVP